MKRWVRNLYVRSLTLNLQMNNIRAIMTGDGAYYLRDIELVPYFGSMAVLTIQEMINREALYENNKRYDRSYSINTIQKDA